MTAFVIDASAVGPLVIDDEREPHAARIRLLLLDAHLAAPSHWPFEVGNMLLVAMRRGRLTASRRVEAQSRLAALAVGLDSQSVDRAWSDCIDLAVSEALTVYDAAYLELARRKGYGLLTLDVPLRDAARAHGIATPLIP